MKTLPIVLLILDGWGIPSQEDASSVVHHVHTPTLYSLTSLPTTTRLQTDGTAVGLPTGYMGNSEVGHLTIGSGRIIHQDFIAIENSIEDASFFSLPKLVSAIEQTKAHNGNFHCMGLLSASGVHSHINHIKACICLAKQYSIPLYLHLFTDGRDSGAFEGIEFLEEIQKIILQENYGTIASLVGRYYAMDRDNRLERTQKAYDCLTEEGDIYPSTPNTYLKESYAKNQTDEFLEPAIFFPNSRIQDGDSLFFINFRADRARQLTKAFLFPEKLPIPREKKALTACITMTQYEKDLYTIALFEKEQPAHTLGEVLEEHGLKQLRIAETEKYAHVTYFFNGGRETPSANEEQIVLPSPKDVPTYDKKPEMSAYPVTDVLVNAIRNRIYDVYICNLANLDMVGHTGNIEATKKALEVVDTCVHTIREAVHAVNGTLIVTADHGNIEAVSVDSTQLHTQHTCNNVYCCIDLPKQCTMKSLSASGGLQDIAPTILYLAGIAKPKEMTGKTLITITP